MEAIHNNLKIKDLLIETREELLYIKSVINTNQLSEEEAEGLKNILNNIANNINYSINTINLNTINN